MTARTWAGRGPVPDEASALVRAAERMTLVLRAGLVSSLTLFGVALLLFVLENPHRLSGSVVNAPRLVGYLGGSGLVQGLLAARPEALLTLAVFVLVATPILRVATGIYFFRVARDRALARLTTVVLVLLLVSVFLVGPFLR